jgi:hypothetical protein
MIKRAWLLLKRKENWESRQSWHFYALIFLGAFISGILSL